MSRCIYYSMLIAFSGISGLYAENYPIKPVRLIVAQAAGSSTDLIARLIAAQLTRELTHPVIVDIRPGAGGLLGTELVAKSPADGYTLQLATIATHGVIPALYKKLPFDVINDFSGVTLAAVTPNALIVHPSLPVKSVSELIDFAKKHPNEINFGSSGTGGAQHMAAELFVSLSGQRAMTHIAYKGTTPALTGLVSGEVQWMLPSLSSAMGSVTSRKVRLLAISSVKRDATMPEVPVIAETIKGFEVESWWGVVAPKSIPNAVTDLLNSSIGKALMLPDTVSKLASDGLRVKLMNPEKFDEFIKKEVTKWSQLVRDNKIIQQ